MREGAIPEPDPGRDAGSSRDSERAALARLTRLGGHRLASDLAAIYLDEMPKRLEAARDALRGRDAAALAAVAHVMKSGSAQLGATALAAACEATEAAAERGDLARAETDFLTAQRHLASFSKWLAEHTGVGRAAADADSGPHARRAPRDRGIIAVVEDNADNRLLVDAILGDRYVLHEYASGPRALAGMLVERPNLVLLDVSLPEMDGLEVLARMRAEPSLRDVPVVALTAHAMAGDRERYLAAGFDDYVPKPLVDDRVLVSAIERLLVRETLSNGGGRDASQGDASEPGA